MRAGLEAVASGHRRSEGGVEGLCATPHRSQACVDSTFRYWMRGRACPSALPGHSLVELVLGYRLGRGEVEDGGVSSVVERWTTRGREWRGRGGQVEVLEDLHHVVGLGDEAHFVAAFGASQRERLVDPGDEETPKRGGAQPEPGLGYCMPSS